MKKILTISILLVQSILFAQEKRPNILILFADDYAYQACGFNGNEEG